ncbi:MAG: hypothetical protein WBD79_22320 [Anaerolineae bacterium]|nr:hypothetical protein [Anaerolineae bacterium]
MKDGKTEQVEGVKPMNESETPKSAKRTQPNWPLRISLFVTLVAAFGYGPKVHWSLFPLLIQIAFNLAFYFAVAWLARAGWRLIYRAIRR